MNHGADPMLGKKVEDFAAIADIQRVVRVTLHAVEELLQAPQGVALWTEEIGPHVVVDTVDTMTTPCKVFDSLRAN